MSARSQIPHTVFAIKYRAAPRFRQFDAVMRLCEEQRARTVAIELDFRRRDSVPGRGWATFALA